MNPRKRIIFINQNSGYLMIDIVNAYADAGYSCVLLMGRLIQRNTSLRPTVRLDQIIEYDRTTTFRRFMTWGLGFLNIWLKIVFKYRKDNLFIVSNPPLAPLLPLVIKNPFQLLIFDIYPDVLLELGYLSQNSFLLRGWRKANKKIFAKATRIFTITNSMKQVLKEYAGNMGVEVIPVWTDNAFLKPIDQSKNSFLKRHNLCGKFIVMYSGNIGLSGDVDILIDVAAEIKRDDIIFLIVGDGVKKEMIQEKSKNLALKNVIILPWQPVSELPFSLSSANLAVISLGIKASKFAIPSKISNFLSVGAPLLCIAGKDSEVENLVNKYECGKCFVPNDIRGIVNFIIDVESNKDLQKLMKNNSLKASDDFTAANVNKFLPETL